MALPHKRQLTFVALTIVLVVGALEIGSFALLSAATGRLQSHGDLQERRRELGAASLTELEVAEDEKAWRQHRIAFPQYLHPYVGYIHSAVDESNPVHQTLNSEYDEQALDFGFPENFRDLFRPAAEDEVVIAVFGGSFAAHMATQRELLRAALRAEIPWLHNHRIAILSFAIGGYKQPQQLMALNYVLSLGADIDLVVNIDGFNEIALAPTTNVPKGYSPYYPRGWLVMVDDLDPELRRTIGELNYLEGERIELARGFERFPWRYSLAAGALWTALDRRLAGRIAEREHRALAGERSPSAVYQARGPRTEYPSEKAMYEDLTGLWRRSSLQMYHLCRGLGIDYYHFLQPNQYVPGSKNLTPTEKRTAWNETHPYKSAVPKGYPLLVAAGKKLSDAGVPFTDLSRLYADVRETVYIDACCHVNHRGRVLVAEAMARELADWTLK